MNKKRSPFLAATLSVIAPGLGHIYAGSLKKGICLIIFECVILLIVGLSGILVTFHGILLFILAIFIFYLFSVISSARLALKNKQFRLKPYNRWYWYLCIWSILAIGSHLVMTYRTQLFGYQTYQVTANSMKPMLQTGDVIMVTTRYSHPKVGDVIAFHTPLNEKVIYVKRIAATGGDTISIRNGTVFRDGKIEKKLDVPKNQREKPFSISMSTRHIPKGYVFLLGDWRDNSLDSRFYGIIPARDILGKAQYVWISPDAARIGSIIK